jgi:hypothetical protein
MGGLRRTFEPLEQRALLSMTPVDLSSLTSPGQTIAFEAETFASRSEGGSHTWWNIAAEKPVAGTMFGATTPYLQALSPAGADTSTINYNPAAPFVDYTIQVSQAGQYALDLKVAGRSGGGSLWARFEGAYASNVQGRGVNTSALEIPAGTSGFFNWTDAGVWNLPAGTITLRVSMRESGAALDGLRIERISAAAPVTPPPTTPPAVNPPFALGTIEAAAFHAQTSGNGHQWTARSADANGVGGLSGSSGGFVQALNTAGADSSTANVNPGTPYVDYVVAVPTAGRYSLDVRAAGRSGSSSLFARVLDTYAVDVQGLGVNSSALLVNATTSGAFEWRDAGVWNLPAGNQTIRVWMRESGVALDALRLEAEAPVTPPPTTPPPTTPPPTTPPPVEPPTTPPTNPPAAPTANSEVVIEAENLLARQTAQGHQWWIVDAERASVGTYFGATGPSADFVQSLSTAGADTTTEINLPSGPYVEYAIDVPAAGRYDLDLRVSGRSGGRSVFVRVVDAYAVDVQGLGVNSSALIVQSNTSGFFAWQDAGIWQLPAGRQTIRVWMRESGTSLDALRVTPIATTSPPPTTPPETTPPTTPPPMPAFSTGEIQAEAFQVRQNASGHQWWIVDAERTSVGPFYGATGTTGDFIEALDTKGAETSTALNAPNGPYVDYVVNVPASGRYELDLRIAGQGGGKSVFARLLDSYAVDTQGLGVNTSALVVEANINGIFTWQDAGIWQLAAGQQTIRVWMRESGAALDALQLQSMTPPVQPTGNLPLGTFQAEDFQRRAAAAGHQWWIADAERSASGVFRGATGPSHDFLQPLTTSGADSTQTSTATAGPYVEYDIQIPQAGRYALRLNMAGKSGGESLWASFLSGTLSDAQGRTASSGALQITSDTSATFSWLTAGMWDLPAGKVTLRIGMRASGAVLDAISLEAFSLFLPGPTTDGQWLQYRGDGALSGHTGLVGSITDPSIVWSLDVSGRETLSEFSLGGSEAQSLALPSAGGVDRTDLLNQIWGIGGPYEYLDGGSRWWLVGRETSGVANLLDEDGLPTTYLQALSSGGLASGSAVAGTNGPGVEFTLSVPTAGTYQLRLDAAGLDTQRNTLFARAVGGTLVDAMGAGLNSDAVVVSAATDGRFHEVAAGRWQLTAGTVTIRVSMNEIGAALRGLRLVDDQGQTVAAAAASDLARRDPVPIAEQRPQTPTSDPERIGDFLPNTPGLEKLTFEQLNSASDGVVRLYKRSQGQWVQVWQTGTIKVLGVQPNLITGDFDRDGVLEAAFAAWDDLYVLNINTGAIEQKVRFTASGASSGRPYGWLGAKDLNGDGRQEFVILADFENNLSVVGWNSSGKLTKLWDYTIESGVVDKQTIHNTGYDPLHDVNGDGVVDIVTSIFNETGDNRWHVVVRSGMTGQVIANVPGQFYWGGADLDGDGRTELFVSQASTGAVLPSVADLSVLEFESGAMQTRWQQSAAAFQLQEVIDFSDNMNAGAAGARQRLLIGAIDVGGPLTFFTRQVVDAATVQTQVTAWQHGPAGIQAVGKLTGPRLEVLAVGAAPGEAGLLVRTSGALDASEAIAAVGFSGAALQSRRTGTPLTSVVVAPLAPGEQPTLVVQTPFEQLTAFQVSAEGSPTGVWTQSGRGSYVGMNTITGQLGFGNVVLADLLGDGSLATLAGARGSAGQARLVALDRNGQELWGHDFDHIPGAAPDWNSGGLTVWMVGHFRSTEYMDVMVTVRRGTMHSDELYLLDGRTGEMVWTREYGHTPGTTFVPRGGGGAQMTVVDWDADGLDEAINMWPDAFYVVDGNGQNLVDRSFMDDVYGTKQPTQQGIAIVADFLANGSQTILHAASMYVLALLDRNANPLWRTASGVEQTLWSPAVGDFDGDNDLDIISSARDSSTLMSYDARTGAVRWTLNLPGIPGPGVSGDLDGDGRDEALFAVGNTLYCIGATPDGRAGRIEWSRSFSSTIGMPILADVTGQGQLQIVVVSQDGYVYGLA